MPPVEIAAHLRRKAQFKMRSLVSEIRDVHWARQTVLGRLQPGGMIEFNHIDYVLIALDHALVSIRTLDLVFQDSDASAYDVLRGQRGQVVRGLTAPRNAAIHAAEVIDPDITRGVGPAHGQFIIFPRWKDRSVIPNSAFAKTAPRSLEAYDMAVAGRHLHDTLFDALKFFDTCDSHLLTRDDEGQIEGLPLPPLPIPVYCRVHPDWPSHEEVDERISAKVAITPPAGLKRRVDGFVETDAHGTYVCGYTELMVGRTKAFTEPVGQVMVDVQMGYVYEAAIAGVTHVIDGNSGKLVVASIRLQESGWSDLTNTDPWLAWADLAATDAAYYREQRMP